MTVTMCLLLAIAGPSACVRNQPAGEGEGAVAMSLAYDTLPHFEPVGFIEHWVQDGRKAYFHAQRREVVAEALAGRFVRISGFPADLGRIVACGWTPEGVFFVHLSPGVDGGTMLHIDLAERKVIRQEVWGAY